MGNVRALERIILRSDGVLQKKRAHIVQQRYNQDGYLQCRLSKDGVRKLFGVHRLVAMAFVPNPHHYPEVNHLDAIRDHNTPDNLMWCTHRENIHYAIELGNHVCTRDLTGENNPNYGNHALKDYYSANPNKAIELLSRPGAQNGRACRVTCADRDGRMIEFDWIGGCAEYLRQCGYTHNSVAAIRDNISRARKNGKPYLGCYFS